MSQISQSTNSINELLEIFKHFRDENTKESELFSSQAIEEPFDVNSTRGDSFTLEPFSFSKEKKQKAPFGLYSSLQKVNCSKEKIFQFSTRQSHAQNQSYSNSIFDKLYNQNKVLRERRQKLFQEGRRSIQAKEDKECTFSPNKKLKTRTERSVSIEESQAFFKKNMEWESKRQVSIKRKQCDKHSTEKNHLTFAPKITSFKKKGLSNKENSHYTSTKRKNDSYLQNYHSRTNRQREVENSRLEESKQGILTMKKGYFSYVH